MIHRLIAILLVICLSAGGSLFAAPRTAPASRCADGACVPKRSTFGYHAGGWRKWPGGKASDIDVRPGAAKRAPLRDLPAVELPDPQHEDASSQPLAPPRSDQPDITGRTADPKQSDPPPLPPIDPEDAPPGLPKTMLESDPKPKPPASPLNELFRNTPLPEPSPGQGADRAPRAATAGMPLTIFRPSSKVRSGEVKADDLSTLPTLSRPHTRKNEPLPGRYKSGVFMAPGKLAQVSRTKKSNFDSQWTNPLRAELATGRIVPSGFVAKVFSPPARNDRTAPGMDKLNGSLSQGVEVLGQNSEPELALSPSRSPPEGDQSEVSNHEPARSMVSSGSLSNQNPLREGVRVDQYVKPVSYEAPSTPKNSNESPERDNPLRSGR